MGPSPRQRGLSPVIRQTRVSADWLLAGPLGDSSPLGPSPRQRGLSPVIGQTTGSADWLQVGPLGTAPFGDSPTASRAGQGSAD